MTNWDDLRLFLAVARAESLTAAAPGLKLDPATLSRRISRLEAGLGVVLFAKSPRGYALTEPGERLRAQAVLAEEALNTGLAGAAGAQAGQGLSGQLRIGAPDGCANFLLPQVAARLQAENPGLEVQILAQPRVVNLSKREADIGITVSPPVAGRLTVQKITDYQLHLAMRADLPRPTALNDLKNLAITGYIPDMVFDQELDFLKEIGTDKVQMASNSVAVQLMMLRQGGIGIVHDFALPFAPDLVRVLRDAVSLRRQFYLIRHSADRGSERLDRLANALISGIRAEVSKLESLVALTEGALGRDAETQSVGALNQNGA